MELISSIKSIFAPKVKEEPQASKKPMYIPEYEIFDGEQSPGEMGPPKIYQINFEQLANRSWQLYAESGLAKILVNTMVDWVIGAGLKLQCEPDESIIKAEGYKLDKNFTEITEARFRILAKSKETGHDKQNSFNEMQAVILKTALLSGDCLEVIRYDNVPTIEAIDGRKIATPMDHDERSRVEKRGNKVIHGVEVSPSGEHIAYYVSKESYGEFTRIPAKGDKTNRFQARLIYGDEYRIDSIRGVPIFAADMEKMKKMDRYINATIAAVEERAKVPWTIEHNHFSKGENPMVNDIMQGVTAGVSPSDLMTQGDKLASQVAITEEKKVYNLPIGSQFKTVSSSTENNLPDFVDTNFIYICAATGIPYEVALMKYMNSYSASRMASQTWQILMNIRREKFTSNAIMPYYSLFLYTEVLKDKINAPGFRDAIMSNDVILVGAYLNARFIGHNVPQADPSKEVKAEVLKLQNYLTTYDKASEALGTGDAKNNIIKLAKELTAILETIPEEFIAQIDSEADSAELGDDPD